MDLVELARADKDGEVRSWQHLVFVGTMIIRNSDHSNQLLASVTGDRSRLQAVKAQR